MPSETHHIHINLNLDSPVAILQRAIQRIIYLVSGALASSTDTVDDPLLLPEVGIQANFDPSLKWSPIQVRTELKTWILQNGFRDAVESLSVFLEESHKISSAWALIKRQESGDQLTGADLSSLQESDPKTFHRLGLPDKFGHFRDSHGILVDPQLLKNILSVNTARNCLVHRGGIVGEKDSINNILEVTWRRLKLIAIDSLGEHELQMGVVYPEGATIALKLVEESKIFNIGESIIFTAQEFQNIVWSLFMFSNDFKATLIEWGKANGFPISTQPGACHESQPN